LSNERKDEYPLDPARRIEMSADTAVASRLAPQANSSEMSESEHFAQFYDNDAFLLNEVGRFAATGLDAGDRVIVIASEPHRNGLEERLWGRGLDVAAAFAQGHYVPLDAAEALSKVMVNGWPDEGRFTGEIGGVITPAAAADGRRRVRVFGEMAALLWAVGSADAAIRLEELWNDLAKNHRFSLFCAYPIAGFSKRAHASPLLQICAAHAQVIPAESYTALASPDERLRTITQLQQKANALEGESAAREKIEKSLFRRERELSDFFQNAVEGLHQVGPDGRIMWANKSQLHLLGYSAEEYIGQYVADFHVHREVIEDMWARLMRGESFYNHPAELRCKNGSIKHVLIHSNALWEDGKLVYARCFIRDVTERRELEAEMKARLEQLAQLDRRKDEFLAVLSHELRTQLNAMLGWVLMLRSGQLDGERTAHALDVIERSTWTQAHLIDDLLDASRIISGKLTFEPRPVSLIAVVEAAIESVASAAASKGLTLVSGLDASSAPVWGDPARLQQVMVNLLSNAIKFTPRGGRVDVRLERDKATARITVSDTGQGIRSDVLPRIFDPFRQAGSTSTRVHDGLGLGLAIVRNMIELHHGTVEAHSTGEGEGATFTVRLPLLAAGVGLPIERAAWEPAPEARSLKGVRVLIVEDDTDTRNLLRWTLTEAGADAVAVATAADALTALRQGRHDLLLSDIGMPGLDGHDLIRHVRAAPDGWVQDIPAIALTAFASKDDAARARAAGFHMHLAKPVDPAALVQAIARLVKVRET
jgi:PAS domain S-box-containing protein